MIVRSTCGLCHNGCGVLIHVEDGQPTRIEGDPDSPINQGSLCIKGQASLEYLYHPDRLRYPLQRVGQRGVGKWQAISWDKALDLLAENLATIKDNYGAEALAIIEGAAKGIHDSYPPRFANVFGTPNIAKAGHICDVPRSRASAVTCGFRPYADFNYPPRCIVIWGLNPAENYHYLYPQILRAIDQGTKLIVIDPRKTELAERADWWLPVRPASDLALALAMMNVIINESLYDKSFVDGWTVGFDQLKAHVQNYPPQKVGEIAWVDPEAITAIARLYATSKPACIAWGNALDNNVNSFQAARALSILRAITGNLEIPGGELRRVPLPTAGRSSAQLELREKMPKSTFEKRVSADLELIPIFRDVLPQSIVKAILEEEPYPIRGIYIQGSNPLITHGHARETHQAFMKLDLLAVADMFMTPTAAMADLVLPVASYLEYDSVFVPADNTVAQVQQKVAQIGECRSDYEIWSGLAKRLGLGQYFWDTEEQCLDALLQPLGLTFAEFRQVGFISGATPYRSYERNGFDTPSHKVEIYSSLLEEWGVDPLPTYYEPPETPYSDPELYWEYPLVLTDWKLAAYRHSSGRQIKSLRSTHPDPVVCIHPETAQKQGINEGDWVYVATKRGKIQQKAELTTNIDPKVVGIDLDFWYPEKGASSMYGWSESNVNVLTDNKPPFSRELGSNNFRGILCRVYKAPD
jgi:anaerobic selenocysteine-containing dehydrogenase